MCINGFHLSNINRPPRPILPRNLKGAVVTPFFVEESDGGTMPAAANFSGTKGFVNNKTGSRGSYMKPM